MDKILISEVGPRDGLQSVKSIMPTAKKMAWMRALHACGIAEIEAASFVPAAIAPQMADASEVVRYCTTLPHWQVVGLVPNLKGAEAAIAAGAHKITIPVSASESHSLANVRKTRIAMIEEVQRIVNHVRVARPSMMIEAGMSTAFGCSIEGTVPPTAVLWLAEALAKTGVDEVGLSDTTGYANPAQVKALFKQLQALLGKQAGSAHMHNTRGLGLANCLAAYEVGVTTFDASQGGIGGCPYAPGASGNVVTEDLVFMFEAMGVATGIDLPRLLAARELLQAGLPSETLYGMVPEAGLPKNFANGVVS